MYRHHDPTETVAALAELARRPPLGLRLERDTLARTLEPRGRFRGPWRPIAADPSRLVAVHRPEQYRAAWAELRDALAAAWAEILESFRPLAELLAELLPDLEAAREADLRTEAARLSTLEELAGRWPEIADVPPIPRIVADRLLERHARPELGPGDDG